MILIDTSAWIDFFRGRGPLDAGVDALLKSGDAALCGPILTELRRGLRPGLHREAGGRRVLDLLDACELLSQPRDLWVEAGEIGAALAGRGQVVKTVDLLIATYALSHDVPLLTRDSDFERMQQAGVPLRLA